jgi:hypothetical protein
MNDPSGARRIAFGCVAIAIVAVVVAAVLAVIFLWDVNAV